MNFFCKIILLFSAITLLGACSKDPAAEQIPGAARLSLTIDGDAIAVQGTRAVSESAVSNLWVLQFDASGAQLTRQYISSIADPSSIVLPTDLTKTANSTLYLVANTGNASLFTTQTLAQAKEVTVALITTTGGGIPTDASTALPMVGQSAALTFPAIAAIPVNLTRTVAKVTLTVKNLLTTGYPRLTVTSTQLCNVPKTYSTQIVDAANGFTGATYYPSAAAANLTSYTAVTGNTTAAGTTTTYYLAPNVRGVGTATDPLLKSDATAAAGQGAYCTYVEILGMAWASTSAPATDVRYRLYLGGNNTNDFNLQSNTAYTVGIELAGLYTSDARLTITTDKFDLAQGPSDGDNTGGAGDGWLGGDISLTDNPQDSPYFISAKTKETIAKIIWGPTAATGALDIYEGKVNTDKIMAMGTASQYPAAKYCRDLGADWYLPAQVQAKLMWVYLPAIPTADRPLASDTFWTSTEHILGSTEAWYINYHTGDTYIFDKTLDTRYVRCVKNGTFSAFGDWKYPKVENGNIITSRSAANGIKESALLTTAQKAFLMNQSTQPIYNEQSEYNKVSAKFQVAADISTSSVWATAYTDCKSYSEGGAGAGSWRLPTQRELMLMYILKSKLTACGNITSTSTDYWAGTSTSTGTCIAWYTGFGTGYTVNNGSNSGRAVRCVRDL